MQALLLTGQFGHRCRSCRRAPLGRPGVHGICNKHFPRPSLVTSTEASEAGASAMSRLTCRQTTALATPFGGWRAGDHFPATKIETLAGAASAVARDVPKRSLWGGVNRLL